MILDILTDAYIFELNSETVIPYIDLVNVLIPAGTKSFRLNFDFNVNISNVAVTLATTSGVTASGFYSEIQDLGYPCAHYSFSDCLDQVNPNYVDINFENYGCLPTQGVVCSGIMCGGASYLKSEPYFLFSCAYTNLLYIKPTGYSSGVTQDNMFFRAEGPTNEVLGLGINQDNNLSLMLYDGSSETLVDTGLTVISGTWNLISIRCQPKTKLRIGCSNEITSEFVEINRSCVFLGGSTVVFLGGKPGIGNFKGVLSDYTHWSSYCDNIFIENAWTYPKIALNGQRRSISTSTTTLGFVFDLGKNYPSQIYLNFDFPVPNMITGISAHTYDENYILASGVDNLFCGTVVRGHTSTDYPIELYNNTDYQTYAYLFVYDSNRYKALSISSDEENYISNAISLPQTISWTSGEYNSGINNNIVINIPYDTNINSSGAIILHDNSRKCLWYLSTAD